MKRTLIVAWAAFCAVSAPADLSALVGHPETSYLWACLAIDVATVPLCAWLFRRAGQPS